MTRDRELLIGCPVRKRNWILPYWFNHVEDAAAALGMDEGFRWEPEYVFVLDPADEETTDLLNDLDSTYTIHRVYVKEPGREDVRVWDDVRYRHMVEIRNLLLTAVRELDPCVFWSVDSDVLVHPQALQSAFNVLRGADRDPSQTIEQQIEYDQRRFDAVGSKLYMSPGLGAPSYGIWNQGRMGRIDCEGQFAVDVIMAVKLMAPTAYYVDYAYDFEGEDIGWSRAARSQGVRLGWDGVVINKHVMHRKLISEVDRRCGY